MHSRLSKAQANTGCLLQCRIESVDNAMDMAASPPREHSFPEQSSGGNPYAIPQASLPGPYTYGQACQNHGLACKPFSATIHLQYLKTCSAFCHIMLTCSSLHARSCLLCCGRDLMQVRQLTLV